MKINRRELIKAGGGVVVGATATQQGLATQTGVFFEVSVEVEPQTVEPGDSVDIVWTITNTGDKTGEQEGEWGFIDPDGNESFTSWEFELGPGEEEVVEQEFQMPEDPDDGTFGVTECQITSEDDTDSATLELQEPGEAVFEVSVEVEPQTVEPGDSVDIVWTITNTGDKTGEQEGEWGWIAPDGTENFNSWEFELAPGEEEVVEQEYQASEGPESFGVAEYQITSEDDTDSATLELLEDNTPPNAAFTATPEDPTVGDMLTLDASGSNDPDGTIETYEWKIGDGDTFTSGGPEFTTELSQAGEITVFLRVTDDDGETDTVSKSVLVEENTPPNAAFTVTPEDPTVGDTLTFDGSESNDPDGTIETYEWKIGDGDTFTPEGPEFTTELSEAGEMTVSLRVIDDDNAIDTATQTVVVQPAGVTVTDADEDPVADAEVKVYVQEDHSESEATTPDMRLVNETETDSSGQFIPPTSFNSIDQRVLITAKKGDWFSVSGKSVDDIDEISDHSAPVLNKQMLVEPTVARVDNSPDNDPYGIVSVWRTVILPEPNTSVISIEVTDVNISSGEELWDVDYVSALHGLSAGHFFLSTPTDATIRQSDSQIEATHPPGPLGTMDPYKDRRPPIEFFHPSNDNSNLPLYPTTRFLNGMQLLETPSKYPGWHEITTEQSEEADEYAEYIQTYTDPMLLDGPITGELCDKTGGCFSPLSVMDYLDGLLDLLDGDRTVATAGRGVNTSYHPDEFPADREVHVQAWEESLPYIYSDTFETSVVGEFEVTNVPQTRPGSQELTRFSVESEWLRQRNNRGIFSDTFTFGPIDVTNSGAVETSPGESASIDAWIHNRSLDEVIITEVAVGGEPLTDQITDSVNITLSPGERFLYNTSADISPNQDTNQEVTIEVTDANQNTTLTSTTIEVNDNTEMALMTESAMLPSETTGTVKSVNINTGGDSVSVRVAPRNNQTYQVGGEATVAVNVTNEQSDVAIQYQGEEYSVSDGEALLPLNEPGEHDMIVEFNDSEREVTITVEESNADNSSNESNGDSGDDSGSGGNAGDNNDGSTSRNGNSDDGSGIGTTEMAVVGGGGALALLSGAYALMRRSGDDDRTKSNQTTETPSQRTGGTSQGKSSRSTDGPRQGQPSQQTGGTGQGQPSRGTSGTGQGQPSQGSDDRSTKRSTQFCPHCGETLSIEAQRCTNCGSDLNSPGT